MRHYVKCVKVWFLKKNIRRKINIIAMVVIMMSTLLIMVSTGVVFSRTMIKTGIEQLSQDSNLVITNITNIMKSAESYANDLTVQLNNYFIADNNMSGNGYEKYNRSEVIKRTIRNVLYVHHQIYGVMFISNDGASITSDNLLPTSRYESILSACKSLQKNGSNGAWKDMKHLSFIGENQNVCVYSKQVIHINTGKPIGSISVMIAESVLSDCFSRQKSSRPSRYFFCNKEGIVVSSENKNDLLMPVENKKLKKWILTSSQSHCILKLNEQNMLVTKTPYSMMEWQLIGIIPINDLLKSCRQMLAIIALLGCLTLAAGILLFNKLSLTITRPLQTLITDVENLNLDNLSAVTKVEAEDDVGVLAKSYNNMKLRIHELVINDTLVQKNARKLELKLLQDQIKPHFFYNTLQLVYAMIDMGDKEKAERCIKSLADFYRLTLNNGRDIITMEEELASTQDYLYLQKIRHTDVFDYQISCLDELKGYRILKLILQPIVENAIHHGFTPKTQNGMIRITVQKQKDVVLIEVTDNGCGMKPEVVAALLSPMGNQKKESFGLRNVDERIKLYFGQSYGLKISSVETQGTSVSIYLPAFEFEQKE